MTRAKARFLAILLPLGMAACSTSGTYPSLALRDVERINWTASPVSGENPPPATPMPPASADLLRQVNALVASAQDADSRFQSLRPATTRAVSAAGSASSDSWSAASASLGQLESSRSKAMGALAQLDVLYADARDAAPTQESPSALAIGEARSKVAAILKNQDDVLATLLTRLRT